MRLRQIDHYYRRRHLDGTTGINRLYGDVVAQRDDDEALVIDCPWVGPIFDDPVTGRRGNESRVITRIAPVAMRRWLWPARPLRLIEMYGSQGNDPIYRIDFATPPQRRGEASFQTDLYLDIFATAANDYAILDEDEVEIALRLGLLTGEQHQQIVAQMDELVDLLEAGRFRVWLDEQCPTPFSITTLADPPGWDYFESEAAVPDGWPQDE